MVRPPPASSIAKAATSIRPSPRGRAPPGIWPASRSTTRSGGIAAIRLSSRGNKRVSWSTPGSRPLGARPRPISKSILPTTTRMSSKAMRRPWPAAGCPGCARLTGRWAGCWQARTPASCTIPTPTPSSPTSVARRRRPGGRASRRSNTPTPVPTAPSTTSGSRTRSPGSTARSPKPISTTAACSVTGNTAAALPATTACLGSAAFFSPLQATWPEAIGTARINQPWGHVQIGGVLRTDYLNDGQYLDQKYVGYGGTISFDAHPFSGNPGPLGKDDMGGGTCIGTQVGGQCANGFGVVTNFGAPIFVPGVGVVNPLTSTAWNARDSGQSLPATGIVNGINVRQAYDRLVSTQSPNSYGGWIWYQHWWTDNLRSTLEISGIWNDANTNILGPGTTNNKLLSIAHGNLFWSPVAFIDFGAEYGWGHRVTVANFKGDAYTIQGEMRVRF